MWESKRSTSLTLSGLAKVLNVFDGSTKRFVYPEAFKCSVHFIEKSS